VNAGPELSAPAGDEACAMNIIGKIFLFAVFIMSLVLMTFAGAIYFSHVNWKDEVERRPEACLPGQLPGYKHQLEQAEAERAKLDAQINRLQQQVAESEQARDQVMAKLQSAIVQKDKELIALKEEREKREEDQRQKVVLLEQTTKDLEEARGQVDELIKKIAAQQAKVDSQVDRSAELSAQLAESKSFLAIAEERKAQLEKQVVNARLLLKQSGLDLDSLPKDRVPELEGQVIAVASGSIEVSLGSDDGLQAEHVLEVYRGGEYVGRAVVTSVSSDRAVARLVKAYARGVVQRGDRVTTRLKA
jgi:cell division protein FtsB